MSMVQTTERLGLKDLNIVADLLAKNILLSTRINCANSDHKKFNAVEYFYKENLNVLYNRVGERSTIIVSNSDSFRLIFFGLKRYVPEPIGLESRV